MLTVFVYCSTLCAAPRRLRSFRVIVTPVVTLLDLLVLMLCLLEAPMQSTCQRDHTSTAMHCMSHSQQERECEKKVGCRRAVLGDLCLFPHIGELSRRRNGHAGNHRSASARQSDGVVSLSVSCVLACMHDKHPLMPAVEA
jgi:hypothetical protein